MYYSFNVHTKQMTWSCKLIKPPMCIHLPFSDAFFFPIFARCNFQYKRTSFLDRTIELWYCFKLYLSNFYSFPNTKHIKFPQWNTFPNIGKDWDSKNFLPPLKKSGSATASRKDICSLVPSCWKTFCLLYPVSPVCFLSIVLSRWCRIEIIAC